MFLGFAPARAAGKESAANKTPLSKLPACHIQAISLLCVFFSFLISLAIPREAEAGDGLALPGLGLGNGYPVLALAC